MAHEKNAMLAQEQREWKSKWQLERSELESGIVQLTAQQTQLVGTIRKKDADFERLQMYLQKSQSSSQRNAAATATNSTSSSASASVSSTALVVTHTSHAPTIPLSSTSAPGANSGLVISKPLSKQQSSASHTQPALTNVVRDVTVHSLTQLLRESQVRASLIIN